MVQISRTHGTSASPQLCPLAQFNSSHLEKNMQPVTQNTSCNQVDSAFSHCSRITLDFTWIWTRPPRSDALATLIVVCTRVWFLCYPIKRHRGGKLPKVPNRSKDCISIVWESVLRVAWLWERHRERKTREISTHFLKIPGILWKSINVYMTPNFKSITRSVQVWPSIFMSVFDCPRLAAS